MTDLCVRTALVTGSSRGIGRAIAVELARFGIDIVVNYVQSKSQAHQVAEEISTIGRKVEVVRADVSNPDDVARLLHIAIQRFGRVDILVNNAGITRDRTLLKMSDDEWDQVLKVDLYAIYYVTKAVVSHMLANGGHIVNIASIVGQTGAFGQTNYAAAKAGVMSFTKSAAIEMAKYGIKVNAVCPGYIATDMLNAVPERVRQQILDRIPLHRFGAPEDVARVVRFLVTEGDYITGQCIHVNGGLWM